MADVAEDSFTESTTLLSSDSTNMQSFELEEGPNIAGGLTPVTAVLFVIGNILGAGLVAVPYGAKMASWINIPMFIFIPTITCICGVFLARSIDMTVTRGNSTQSEASREPYPQLAKEAVGDKCRKFVVVVLYCAQISSCLVFLLLAGEILSKLIPIKISGISSHNELRMWISITVGLLLPFNLLGSPKDFWGVALAATVTSLTTSTLIIICLGIFGYHDTAQVTYPKLSAENTFASFGIIVFAFSGVGIFPTVQGDMKEPKKFSSVVIFGFSLLAFVYVSVAQVSYFVLGDRIGEDLLTTFTTFNIYHKNIPFRAFVTISQVLILGHVFSAFVLQMNPVYHLAELTCNAPNEFGWKRCVIRFSIIFVMWILAIVIPNFGPALSLVGGLFNAMLSIIFPIWFYFRLQTDTSTAMKVLFGVIFFIALISIAGNSFVEIRNIILVIQGKYKTV